MIDATYKLNELRMLLYFVIILDSNGQSEIIAVFLTSENVKLIKTIETILLLMF